MLIGDERYVLLIATHQIKASRKRIKGQMRFFITQKENRIALKIAAFKVLLKNVGFKKEIRRLNVNTTLNGLPGIINLRNFGLEVFLFVVGKA